MKLNYKLVAVLVCVMIIISSGVWIKSSIGNIDRNTEDSIRNSAYNIVVQIGVCGAINKDEFVFLGSGVIIEKKDSIYYVITNFHVINNINSYLITVDEKQEKSYKATYIKKADNDEDLALLSFTSNDHYKVAQLGDDANLEVGSQVNVAGFAYPDRGYDLEYYLTPGRIIADINDNSNLRYDNETFDGMSGGAVLDKSGLLVGIHKGLDEEGVSEGISITTIKQFLKGEKELPCDNDDKNKNHFWGVCQSSD